MKLWCPMQAGLSLDPGSAFPPGQRTGAAPPKPHAGPGNLRSHPAPGHPLDLRLAHMYAPNLHARALECLERPLGDGSHPGVRERIRFRLVPSTACVKPKGGPILGGQRRGSLPIPLLFPNFSSRDTNLFPPGGPIPRDKKRGPHVGPCRQDPKEGGGVGRI
jgi:hypothetical protein